MLLIEVENLRLLENWNSDLLLFGLLRVKLDLVIVLDIDLLVVLVIVGLCLLSV